MGSEPLPASFLTTLSATVQSSRVVDDFIRAVPLARTALDPITYELLDLRALLERLLDEAAIPISLHAPILSLAAACRLVLARIDAVLADHGDGPRAKEEIRGLKTGLQTCRRAMRLAREVVNLSTSIEFIADGKSNALGIGVTDIRQDATQILARAYRVRVQVPLPQDDREVNRSAFGLQRGLHGLISYVESFCVENSVSDVSYSRKRDASGYANGAANTAQGPRSPDSLQSPLSMKQMSRELSRASTSESNPNSFSSSESRRTSEASVSWFATEDEDVTSPGIQRKAVPQRRHTNDTIEARRDQQYAAKRGLKLTPQPSPQSYSLYPPPPTKPLPAVPQQRLPSRGSTAAAEKSPALPASPASRTSRGSKGSVATSTSGRASSVSSSKAPLTPLTQVAFSPMPAPSATPPPPPTATGQTSEIEIVPWKHLAQKNDKDHGTVSYLDISFTSSILASKHGNNIIRLWDLRTGTLASSIKVSFYVQSQTRSRDYFVRSHAILSETANLVVIATAFGHSLEVWNWARRKKLQTIEEAYRWASVRSDIYEARWPPLVTYREDGDTLALHPVARDAKKPFGKPRIIDLGRAGLPHIPKYPELTYSATGPLLIAAAGPRPPRPGQPPPDQGAMLMAWEVGDYDDMSPTPAPTNHRPYKFILVAERHPELATALPLCLASYGSVAVSIWVPASYRAVQGKGRTGGWQLEPVAVTSRQVLVWDFAANITRTYSIPDAMACISPDCRFVAYCDPGCGLAVLDALSGRELWRWSGSGGGGGENGETGFGPLRNLEKVAELAFSADGTLFFSGQGDGGVGVYEVREVKRDGR